MWCKANRRGGKLNKISQTQGATLMVALVPEAIQISVLGSTFGQPLLSGRSHFLDWTHNIPHNIHFFKWQASDLSVQASKTFVKLQTNTQKT